MGKRLDKFIESAWFELLKATVPVIASGLISIAIAGVTYYYNHEQLNISESRSEAEIKIACYKELSNLIPRLSSPDPNTRRFAAISLSLYGKDAVPALMAILDDYNQDVRNASVESLSLIGNVAIPQLIEAYSDTRNTFDKRAYALKALARMRAPQVYDIALSELEHPTEPHMVAWAAYALTFIKDDRAIPKLHEAMTIYKDKDPEVVIFILRAFTEIRNLKITDDVINFVYHPNEGVRFEAVKLLGIHGNKNLLSLLSQVEANDKSQKIKQAAQKSINHINLYR